MNIPIITPAFGYVIGFIYDILGNYMWTLVVFAIFIKLILFPFGIKQQKNSIKQAKLRPMEMVIRKKYAGRKDQKSQQKLNEEIMALYQSENFNPASGCLPLLIQMPVLFGLYSVIINPLTYISNLGSEVVAILARVFGLSASYDINIIKAITDMGASVKPGIVSEINAQLTAANITNIDANGIIETVTELQTKFSVFGIDLTVQPTMALNLYLIIPILTFVFAFFSSKLTRKFTYQPQQTQEAASSMAMMDFMMPLLSVWISFSVPSAIAIYWMLQNVLSVVQQFILFKAYPIPEITDEQIKEAELKFKGKTTNKKTKDTLPEIDPNSPIYEEVPDVDYKDENLAVESRPLGLTPKFKNTLKKTGKTPKARKKI